MVTGDVVQLRAGGPRMLVTGHEACGFVVCASVSERGEVVLAAFSPKALRRVVAS